ncbi:META domain-containing protein [Shewanella sp. YIC-542]|uniref:META domain-containing protein n=1 Tax=Shewanella mytili TaxID=3377111 RepID=UPI00398E6EE4
MPKKLLLMLAFCSVSACQSLTTPPITATQLLGDWHIQQINGQPVVDFSPAQLTFAENGKLSGNNSCNNFFGRYQLQAQQLHLMPAGSTMKACVDVLMAQEQQVMQLLPQVVTAERQGNQLRLQGSQGATLLLLQRQ